MVEDSARRGSVLHAAAGRLRGPGAPAGPIHTDEQAGEDKLSVGVARVRAAIVGSLLLLLLPGAGRAAQSCSHECVRRMAECRAARCAGLSRKACRDQCRAVTGCAAGGPRIGTLANVVSDCSSVGGAWTFEQRLEIKRGDCAPIVVMQLAGTGAVPDIGLCRIYGQYRTGAASIVVGPFQRLGLSPHSQTLLFEVSTHNVVFPAPAFEVPEEGIFAVRADGSGMRSLGPASREKPFKGPAPSSYPPGFSIDVEPIFNFSPSGRFVVFSDRGPGADGTDAGQLTVMDVVTGARTQVTAFSATTQDPPSLGANVLGWFLDDDTVLVATQRLGSNGVAVGTGTFLVGRDGGGFHPYEPPVPLGHLVTDFQVTGRRGNAVTLQFDQMVTEPVPNPVQEVFLRDRTNLLQLTNFRRSDTGTAVLTRDGARILFSASADPFGINPTNTCQLFSIGRFAGGLRQLTRFDSGAHTLGCGRDSAPPVCWVGNNRRPEVDSKTGSVVFESSCDPFGLSPISDQFFAMRPDGSGLRQLTNYRGMQVAPDGTLTVELEGPTAYSGE